MNYLLIDEGTDRFEIAVDMRIIARASGNKFWSLLDKAVEVFSNELHEVDGLHFSDDDEFVFITREGCKIIFSPEKLNLLDGNIFHDMYIDYRIDVSDLDKGFSVTECQEIFRKKYIDFEDTPEYLEFLEKLV